jgi:hypothetical protein
MSEEYVEFTIENDPQVYKLAYDFNHSVRQSYSTRPLRPLCQLHS